MNSSTNIFDYIFKNKSTDDYVIVEKIKCDKNIT